MNRKYPKEVREAKIAEIQKVAAEQTGGSINKACDIVGINPTTYKAWTSPDGWASISTTTRHHKNYKKRVKSFDLNQVQESTPPPHLPMVQDNEDDVTLLVVRCKSMAVGNILGAAFNKIYKGV